MSTNTIHDQIIRHAVSQRLVQESTDPKDELSMIHIGVVLLIFFLVFAVCVIICHCMARRSHQGKSETIELIPKVAQIPTSPPTYDVIARIAPVPNDTHL